MRKSRIYTTWVNMRIRCSSPNHKDFQFYGGRGITVCDEWKDDFQAFMSWAFANGYSDTLTIERKEVNGNYEPGNCTWVTIQEQAKNRRPRKRA